MLRTWQVVFFICILLCINNVFALSEDVDPCDNMAGKWQGIGRYQDASCQWDLDCSIQKYKETVDMHVHAKLSKGEGCTKEEDFNQAATCKDAMITFTNGVKGTIFGNRINYTTKNFQVELTKVTTPK